MAKNGVSGDNHRNGQVKKRSQVYNEKINRYVKRNTETGVFIAQKNDGEKFKGIREEK